MPAPLVSALTYLMAPRALNAVSDAATNARMDALLPKLQSLGLSYEEIQKELRSDPYLRALQLISKDPYTGQPRGSGLEETARSLMDLYNANTQQQTAGSYPSEPNAGLTVDDLLAGRSFNDPNVQPGVYVTRGSPYSEDLQFLTPMDDFLRYGGRDDDAGRYFQAQSYGQTDQPATEVRFDQPPGGADGGLAALLRRKNAKR